MASASPKYERIESHIEGDDADGSSHATVTMHISGIHRVVFEMHHNPNVQGHRALRICCVVEHDHPVVAVHAYYGNMYVDAKQMRVFCGACEGQADTWVALDERALKALRVAGFPIKGEPSGPQPTSSKLP